MVVPVFCIVKQRQFIGVELGVCVKVGVTEGVGVFVGVEVGVGVAVVLSGTLTW